jgi:hypothetical protein
VNAAILISFKTSNLSLFFNELIILRQEDNKKLLTCLMLYQLFEFFRGSHNPILFLGIISIGFVIVELFGAPPHKLNFLIKLNSFLFLAIK